MTTAVSNGHPIKIDGKMKVEMLRVTNWQFVECRVFWIFTAAGEFSVNMPLQAIIII